MNQCTVQLQVCEKFLYTWLYKDKSDGGGPEQTNSPTTSDNESFHTNIMNTNTNTIRNKNTISTIHNTMNNGSNFSPERNNHESVTLTRKTYQSEITLPDEFFETADDGPGAGEIAVATSTPLLADPSSRLQTSSNRGKNLEAAHSSSVIFAP